MTIYMLENIRVNEDLLNQEKYKYIFSVEVLNELVLKGVPFRDAYKQVGLEIEAGNFSFQGEPKHTHLGSLGNLGTDQIKLQFEEVFARFEVQKASRAISALQKGVLG